MTKRSRQSKFSTSLFAIEKQSVDQNRVAQLVSFPWIISFFIYSFLPSFAWPIWDTSTKYLLLPSLLARTKNFRPNTVVGTVLKRLARSSCLCESNAQRIPIPPGLIQDKAVLTAWKRNLKKQSQSRRSWGPQTPVWGSLQQLCLIWLKQELEAPESQLEKKVRARKREMIPETTS